MKAETLPASEEKHVCKVPFPIAATPPPPPPPPVILHHQPRDCPNPSGGVGARGFVRDATKPWLLLRCCAAMICVGIAAHWCALLMLVAGRYTPRVAFPLGTVSPSEIRWRRRPAIHFPPTLRRYRSSVCPAESNLLWGVPGIASPEERDCTPSLANTQLVKVVSNASGRYRSREQPLDCCPHNSPDEWSVNDLSALCVCVWCHTPRIQLFEVVIAGTHTHMFHGVPWLGGGETHVRGWTVEVMEMDCVGEELASTTAPRPSSRQKKLKENDVEITGERRGNNESGIIGTSGNLRYKKGKEEQVPGVPNTSTCIQVGKPYAFITVSCKTHDCSVNTRDSHWTLVAVTALDRALSALLYPLFPLRKVLCFRKERGEKEMNQNRGKWAHARARKPELNLAIVRMCSELALAKRSPASNSYLCECYFRRGRRGREMCSGSPAIWCGCWGRGGGGYFLLHDRPEAKEGPRIHHSLSRRHSYFVWIRFFPLAHVRYKHEYRPLSCIVVELAVVVPIRVMEVSMEHSRNERAGETGDPRENPLTNDIVRHDSTYENQDGYTAGLQPMRTEFNPRPGHSRIFESRSLSGRSSWSVGFTGDLPFHPPLHSDAAPFSRHFILIGSPDLVTDNVVLRTRKSVQQQSLASFGFARRGCLCWRRRVRAVGRASWIVSTQGRTGVSEGWRRDLLPYLPHPAEFRKLLAVTSSAGYGLAAETRQLATAVSRPATRLSGGWAMASFAAPLAGRLFATD
ncbi:hypothetical protein PR048_000824 [Dryococelus australis]|uniref:Uncharacterized protein n=1 Tax=Dryococelus australis TaxID=614101 RepID=A0ABQ9IGL0_9NEOP|nr:hypothetical protein PR048_000824 [Dryococelus australis]